MNPATALAYPGGRTLTAWWRQLAPLQPRAIWVAHLILHRVEALVRIEQAAPPDPLSLLLLDVLAETSASTERLEGRFCLNRQFLLRALNSLRRDGLAFSSPEGYWQPTGAGQVARERRTYSRIQHERRSFHFLPGHDGRAAFLPLRRPAGERWLAGDAWRFDVTHLQDCIARPVAWKEEHGFPLDVTALVHGPGAPIDPADAEVPEWQKVIVDHPTCLSAVVILAGAGSEQRLHGLLFRPDGWSLDTTHPVFLLNAVDPEVVPEPNVESWHEAWREACRSRGPAGAEGDACRLEVDGPRLRVFMSREAAQRWRGPAARGELWLLAGEGNARSAAVVEIVEGDAPRDL